MSDWFKDIFNLRLMVDKWWILKRVEQAHRGSVTNADNPFNFMWN